MKLTSLVKSLWLPFGPNPSAPPPRAYPTSFRVTVLARGVDPERTTVASRGGRVDPANTTVQDS